MRQKQKKLEHLSSRGGASVRGLGTLLGVTAVLALLGPAAAVEEGDVALYFHRDGTMDGLVPASADPATHTFSMTDTQGIRFATAALAEPLLLRGPAFVRLHLQNQASVEGRLFGLLEVDGEPVASSESDFVLLDSRPREVILNFLDLRGAVPANATLGLLLDIESAIVVPVVGLEAGNLQVVMEYDGADRTGGLHLLGVERPAQGLAGPSGSVGGDGTNGGGSIGGGDRGEPLAFLGRTGVPPLLVLAGVGTSSIAVLAGLALRGRS